MRIAVLFTCFNRIEKTIGCIESVERAAYLAGAEIEWFVTDGGSSDGTAEMLHFLAGHENVYDAIKSEVLRDKGFKDSPVVVNANIDSKMHARVEKGAYYSQGMKACMQMLDDVCTKAVGTVGYDSEEGARFSESAEIFGNSEPDECFRMLKTAAGTGSRFDYVMLVNDDVEFFEDFLVKMLKYSENAGENTTIVGAACAEVGDKSFDANGDESKRKNRVQTYGGIRYNARPKEYNTGFLNLIKSLLPVSVKYKMVTIGENDLRCDTFNANCVLIPWEAYEASEKMDKHFVHGLGDFDYGLCLKGEKLSTDFYVGVCANNEKSGTWMDTELVKYERVRRLNGVKGAPTKQWFYYLNKHFGFMSAVVYSISPYVRILLGK